MKVTDALLGEHGVLYRLFDHIEMLVAREPDLAELRTATAALETLLVTHAKLEDELLFDALEPHLGTEAPLSIVRAEREEIERLLDKARNSEDSAKAVEWLSQALDLARSHFRKEETVLFVMARRILDDDLSMRLGDAWNTARNVNSS